MENINLLNKQSEFSCFIDQPLEITAFTPISGQASKLARRMIERIDDLMKTESSATFTTTWLGGDLMRIKITHFKDYWGPVAQAAKEETSTGDEERLLIGTYYGQVNGEQVPHGEGMFLYSDGKKFVGTFKNGAPFDGYGTLKDFSSDVYTGGLKQGRRHGRGTLVTLSNKRYTGDFQYGFPTSKSAQSDDSFIKPAKNRDHFGYLRRANEASQRICLVIDDYLKEQASRSLTTQVSTKMIVVNDLKDYWGPIAQAAKEETPTRDEQRLLIGIYYGEVNEDQVPHGKGQFLYSDGKKFAGTFKDGAPFDGYGTLKDFYSGVYTGGVKEGLKHGQGTLLTVSNKRYTGDFQYGTFYGQGKLTWPNGATFEGSFQFGGFHGPGKMTWSEGATFEGDGVVTTPTGFKKQRVDAFTGTMINGVWDQQTNYDRSYGGYR